MQNYKLFKAYDIKVRGSWGRSNRFDSKVIANFHNEVMRNILSSYRQNDIGSLFLLLRCLNDFPRDLISCSLSIPFFFKSNSTWSSEPSGIYDQRFCERNKIIPPDPNWAVHNLSGDQNPDTTYISIIKIAALKLLYYTPFWVEN